MQSRYKVGMRHVLICHPDTPSADVSAIAVDFGRNTAGNLSLHYYVTGLPVVPGYPSPATRRRADGLWQHSCFEAFVKPAGREAYWEFNLAPTWDWQAYALTGYRAGRHPEAGIAAPTVEARYGREGWDLRVQWALAGVVPDSPWQIGLAAVIEDAKGAISYWALKHAPDKPDFHHPDAFALTVTP
jgi:hypothetical protein